MIRTHSCLCLSAALALSAPLAHARAVCNVHAYGAKGDATTKDTHAIQAAIDANRGLPISYAEVSGSDVKVESAEGQPIEKQAGARVNLQ